MGEFAGAAAKRSIELLEVLGQIATRRGYKADARLVLFR